MATTQDPLSGPAEWSRPRSSQHRILDTPSQWFPIWSWAHGQMVVQCPMACELPVCSIPQYLFERVDEHLWPLLRHSMVYAIADIVDDAARVRLILPNSRHNHRNAKAETLLDSAISTIGDKHRNLLQHSESVCIRVLPHADLQKVGRDRAG